MLALIPSLVLLFQPTAYFHCSSMLAPRNPLTKLAIWSASWACLSAFCASWQAILCHCRIVIVSGVEVGLWAVGEWLDEVVRSYSMKEIKLVQSKLAKKEKGGRAHAGSSAVILHDTTVVVHRSRINTVSQVYCLLVFHIRIFLDLFCACISTAFILCSSTSRCTGIEWSGSMWLWDVEKWRKWKTDLYKDIELSRELLTLGKWDAHSIEMNL